MFKEETVEDELIGVSSNLIEKMELINVLKQHPYDISGRATAESCFGKGFGKNLYVFCYWMSLQRQLTEYIGKPWQVNDGFEKSGQDNCYGKS
ncbi:MAG: hypothetical protein ACLRR3_00440 [Eubacterium sp.]